jgi:diguanylate cyclase (GGDEF)-like protein
MAEATARIAVLEAEVQEALFDNGVLRLQLDTLASTDPVTGLPNANGLRDILEKAVARQARCGEPFAVMFIALAALERVAEEFGENCMDDALRHAGALVGASLRRLDTVGRIDDGGLLAVLPMLEGDGVAGVIGRIEHLLTTVPMVLDDETITLIPAFAVVVSDSRRPVDPAITLDELAAAREVAVPGAAVVVRSGVDGPGA